MYGWDNVDTEYNMRLNSYSSYVTDFIIHPIEDEKRQRDVEYPLFFVLNRSLGINLEKVLKTQIELSNFPQKSLKLRMKYILNIY